MIYFVFCEDHGTAKLGDIVDAKYFNYDDMIIHLLLDAKIIEYVEIL